MKLHDLRPAEGANTPRTRVGRGIAAGKGKTAGRGTKGQKARAGGSIPPWFEGGQTPLHMRIPKLRGFKNRGRLVYEIVNVGDIAARIEAGAFAEAGTAPKKGEQLTINADILRAVGLVRDVKKPLKILGNGELATALFVVADAFTKSATAKIEGAGGAVSILEVPAESRPALGVGEAGERTARVPRTAAGRAAADQESTARARRDADTAEAAEETARASAASAAKAEKAEAANAQKADKAEKSPRAAKTPKGETAPADVADAIDSVEPEAAASPADTADAVDSDADAASQAGAEIPAEAADSTESAGSTGAESDSAGDDLPAEAADALDDDATTASSDESA